MSDQRVMSKLTNWIRSEILNERRTGKVVRFELRHLPINSKKGEHVLTLDVDKENPTPEWFENQSAELLSAATSDAEGIKQGLQRYVVSVYRSQDLDTPRGRHPFVIAAPDADDESETGSGGLESEPPTKQGFMAQAMRHLEAAQKTNLELIRTVMSNLGSITQGQARILNSVTSENERMRGQQIEAIETVNELLSAKARLELDTKREEAKIAAIGEGMSQVKLLLPTIVNRISGKTVLPENNGQSMALQRFAESLTDEQKAKLLESLKPEQQLVLGEILQGLN